MPDLSPKMWQFEIHTDKIPTLRAQAVQVADQVPDIPSPKKMAIWDSYWWIPTLRAEADQVADLVHLTKMAISDSYW